MIVRDFLICLLQMYLLEDLEKNMLPYRRENFLGKFLVYFVIALVMLGINHLESSIFNMVMIPVTYMIVSMVVFRGNIWKKLVIVCCYYVLAIIPEVLKIENIDINDNFFELGGDSLLAMKLSVELLKITNKISYSDIFKYSTVSEMEEKINLSNKEKII